MELKARILAYILEKNNVTFAELEWVFPEVVEAPDAGMSEWFGKNNFILWIGWSRAAFDVIKELMETDQIVGKSSSVLIYYIDGRVLSLPTVKRTHPPYKRPHWAPMRLCRP